MTKVETDIELVTTQEYKLKDLILDGRYTKTTHFLLPGLHISGNMQIFTKYFVNAYIDDGFITHIVKNPVFCLFKTKVFDQNWKNFEAAIKSSPRCIYEYNVGKNDDDYLVMFLFEFPSAYRSDYFKFIEGEYSQFSGLYKKLFSETAIDSTGQKIENPLYGVVNKTSSFKRSLEHVVGAPIDSRYEYWEKWSTDREVFRKN